MPAVPQVDGTHGTYFQLQVLHNLLLKAVTTAASSYEVLVFAPVKQMTVKRKLPKMAVQTAILQRVKSSSLSNKLNLRRQQKAVQPKWKKPWIPCR